MEGITYAKEQAAKELAQKITLQFTLKETPSATHATSISILDSARNNLGSICVEKAIGSSFAKRSGLSDKQLHNCAIMHMPIFHNTSSNSNHLALFCYFALRRARIWSCQNIIFAPDVKNDLTNEITQLLKLEPLSHTQFALAQRIKYAILPAYEHCNANEQSFIQSLFIAEILDIFELWVAKLFNESWFRAVSERTISKEQYITSLYNLHQFVRHTTRLAARCVAHSDDRELRNHYIYHLKGEINHELFIEADLQALGVDLDYLLNAHVAHTATAEFIAVQESIIGYRQDPLMMLACPFIAEGMTANITPQFVTDLHATIQSWGVTDPKTVSKFLTSHIKTDGGVDGHWLRVVTVIHKHINSEQMQQQFLCNMRLAMKAYANGLNANIDDLALWGPK